jgi:alcohol dehydrogenase class IV
LAFLNATSLSLVYAGAHALGGLLDLLHGECNALLLDHVIRFNFESAPDRYREVELNELTPIITITVDVTPGVQKRCKDAGINAYLSKPINPLELRNLIHNLTEPL